MSLRSSAVAAAWTAIVLGCAQKPAAQTSTLDTAKVAIDSTMQRADKSRIQGSESAKVWLVIASDFQCPFCRAFHDDVYKRILADYVATGKIRVAYVHHPMAAHPHAVVSAEAAMCAGVQDRFWQMHDALFATQLNWSPRPDPTAVFDSLATSLQLRMSDWRGCMASHKTRAMIDADNARTKAAGVDGTPSFFIANRLAIVGAQPYGDFRAALDSALAHAGPPTESTKRP